MAKQSFFISTLNSIFMEEQSFTTREISIGDWMLTIFLLAIPVINIIMLFVWAFSGETPVSKANFAKATLIWMAIIIVLSLIGLALGISVWRSFY